MKNLVVFFTIIGLVLTCNVANVSGAVTAEDVLEAVEEMTPEQVHLLRQKLLSREWHPVPEGFFDRLALSVSTAPAVMKTVDIDFLNLSAGEMDLEKISGFEIGVAWRFFSPRLHLGFKIDQYACRDEVLNGLGYSRADLSGASALVIASLQMIRTDRFLLWSELGLGGSTVQLEIIDTPHGESTTLRELESSFWVSQISVGMDWRFNPKISLFGSLGYRFAGDSTLQEAGVDTAGEVNAGGGRMGFGFNFNF